MKNKILFIDRDGTIIKDPPPFHRPGQFTGVDFYPFVFEYLGRIARELDYLFVMITNQDGLGSDIFPNEAFWPPHHFIMKLLKTREFALMMYLSTPLSPMKTNQHASPAPDY